MVNQEKIDKLLGLQPSAMMDHEFILEVQMDNGRIDRQDVCYDEMRDALIMYAKLAKPPMVRVFDKTEGVTI